MPLTSTLNSWQQVLAFAIASSADLDPNMSTNTPHHGQTQFTSYCKQRVAYIEEAARVCNCPLQDPLACSIGLKADSHLKQINEPVHSSKNSLNQMTKSANDNEKKPVKWALSA